MRALHELRTEMMLERRQGITLTYNRYHDPACDDADARTLRFLHDELDRAALAAYGWNTIDLKRSFRETDEGMRYTISDMSRIELLDALLELNLLRSDSAKASAPTADQPAFAPAT